MATMSTLRLVPPVGAPIEIQGERALVGRDPTADIVVNDPSVSRRHAVVERRPEGWAVFDQRSANGTWLDNVRIEQALLQPGQQLRLGAVSFEVQVPGAAPPRPFGTMAPQAPVSPYGQPGAPAPPPAYPPQAAPAYAPQPAAPAYPPPAPAYPPPAAAPMYAAPPPPQAYPPPAQAYPPQAAPPGYPQMPAQVYAPPPGQAAPGVPGAPAAPRPAAGPPGAGGMTEAEAAEILGLWPGSPPDEVKRRYQKLFNDFQIRITNAPTPALKKMYQKNIQDLRAAAEALAPGSV
jgi:predicted component of type VI protein secretion system